MSLYEVGMVLSPELDDQAREAFLGELRQLLESQKATLTKEDVWGKKTLAYPIRHKREGYYVFWQFEGSGSVVAPLEYKLRLSDEVLRFLTINLDREMRRARKMAALRAAHQATKAEKSVTEGEGAAPVPTPEQTQRVVPSPGEEA